MADRDSMFNFNHCIVEKNTDCVNHECKNGASCLEVPSGVREYLCSCVGMWTGRFCNGKGMHLMLSCG